MSTYFFYLALLLIMLLLTYFGISCSFKYAPLKIKALSLSALAAVSFRYIALLIFLVMPNIKNLYLLKPFMFLNLLCLPVLAIVSTYIFARNDRVKFNYCIIISILLMIAYIAAIVILPINIKIYGSLGYIMSFNNELLVYGIYLLINTILLFTTMLFLGNRISNKLGVWLLLASAFVVIAELITRTSGIIILPAILFGDIMWVITADYALYKLKK